jgi:hypothetical protein
MAFLDNSGDIILDAVLTDTGRHRMARGDFRITKFALGDDEIDYSLYNKNHPSGSAYYDLEILKTPVLESFTNNTSMMKSKLVTIGRTDFLYMPILKLSDGGNPLKFTDDGQNQNELPLFIHSTLNAVFRSYLITVGTDTDAVVDITANGGQGALAGNGIILGYNNAPSDPADPQFNINPNRIVVETGIDSLDIPPSNGLSGDLADNGFIIEMDSRLGSLVSPPDPATSPGVNVPVTLNPSYIDDDGIASYVVTANTLIEGPKDTNSVIRINNRAQSNHRIRGPRGSMLVFSVLPHNNLRDSDYFFDRLGGTFTGNSTGTNNTPLSTSNNGFVASSVIKFIDTFVRVTGMTTGYTIDIPIRYVKKSSS